MSSNRQPDSQTQYSNKISFASLSSEIQTYIASLRSSSQYDAQTFWELKLASAKEQQEIMMRYTLENTSSSSNSRKSNSSVLTSLSSSSLSSSSSQSETKVTTSSSSSSSSYSSSSVSKAPKKSLENCPPDYFKQYASYLDKASALSNIISLSKTSVSAKSPAPAHLT